jgi:hypothetical protein
MQGELINNQLVHYDEEIDEQQSNNTNGIDRKHERTTGEEGRKRHRLKFQVGILVGRKTVLTLR